MKKGATQEEKRAAWRKSRADLRDRRYRKGQCLNCGGAWTLTAYCPRCRPAQRRYRRNKRCPGRVWDAPDEQMMMGG